MIDRVDWLPVRLSGTTKWVYTQTRGTVTRRGVAIGQGLVFTHGKGNWIIALDQATGQVSWEKQINDYGNMEKVAVTYHGGMLYVGTESAGVWASRGGGVTFRPLGHGLERGRIATLLADPGHPGRLFAAIPFPGLVYSWIAGPLQRIAAEVAVFTLQVTGVDSMRAGTKIYMGNGITSPVRTLNVAEACAGLRSLMTFISVAAAVAFRLFMFLVPYAFVMVTGFGLASSAAGQDPGDAARSAGIGGLFANAVASTSTIEDRTTGRRFARISRSEVDSDSV